MVGGAGNDTYVVDAAGDVVTELPGEGTDTVQSSISYTLGANVENLDADGVGDINATGNTLDNTLTGNAGQQHPRRRRGNDTMAGWRRQRHLCGRCDRRRGDGGSDAGTDTVQSSVSYTLGANVENLTLTGSANINATGNTLNNTLTGNAGNNILERRRRQRHDAGRRRQRHLCGRLRPATW